MPSLSSREVEAHTHSMWSDREGRNRKGWVPSQMIISRSWGKSWEAVGERCAHPRTPGRKMAFQDPNLKEEPRLAMPPQKASTMLLGSLF